MTKELYELSIYAGIEIDNYIINKSTEFKDLKEFINRLRSYDYNGAIETETLLALRGSIKDIFEKKLTYKEEIKQEMNYITNTFDKIPNLPVKKLEQLRDFCINFSKNIF